MKNLKKMVIGLAIGAAIAGVAQAQDAEPTYASCMSDKADLMSIRFSDGPMQIGTCDSNTGRVGLVMPLWKEQMPEIMARLRAEIMGGYAQVQVAGLLGITDTECRGHAVEARTKVDKAAASYFFTSEFTNAYPRGMTVRRINGALAEIYQANAIAQRCKGSNPDSENPVAKYGEEQRIKAMRIRRPVANVVRLDANLE